MPCISAFYRKTLEDSQKTQFLWILDYPLGFKTYFLLKQNAENLNINADFFLSDSIKVLNKFETIADVNKVSDDEEGIKIYIGTESEISDDIAIIKTKYNYNGEEKTIAIIGPKRMEYDRVVSMLEYIKKNIEN